MGGWGTGDKGLETGEKDVDVETSSLDGVCWRGGTENCRCDGSDVSSQPSPKRSWHLKDWKGPSTRTSLAVKPKDKMDNDLFDLSVVTSLTHSLHQIQEPVITAHSLTSRVSQSLTSYCA